jgi:hypothetical protein
MSNIRFSLGSGWSDGHVSCTPPPRHNEPHHHECSSSALKKLRYIRLVQSLYFKGSAPAIFPTGAGIFQIDGIL